MRLIHMTVMACALLLAIAGCTNGPETTTDVKDSGTSTEANQPAAKPFVAYIDIAG